MKLRPVIAGLAALYCGVVPGLAFAQNINVSQSILPDQPYTLIYPETMVLSGMPGERITLNHPDAPLQCDLTIVPVEDTGWTADAALNGLNDDEVSSGWAENFPGFVLGTKGTTSYQSTTALIYDGTSTDSPMGVPLTIVHTETVDEGRGYTLDCLFATASAEQARPLVDFIVANFSTRSDADCCVGAPADPQTAPAP